MLECNSCGSVQDVGKFCGKCGELLTEATGGLQEIVATKEVPVAENTGEAMEKVVETSKVFWDYFISHLKQPSRIFTKPGSEVKNGLISMITLVILMALSTYSLTSNFGGYGYGYSSSGPSFLSVFVNTAIIIAVAIAIIITLLFLINKLFGTDCTFKEMVGIYGAHMTSVIVLAVLALLFTIVKSNTYGAIFMVVALGFILTMIPLYLISSLLTRSSKNIDPLYGYILYIVLAVITYLIFISILADSALGEFLDNMSYWF